MKKYFSFLLFIIACNTNQYYYAAYKSVKENNWKAKETLSFFVDIEDTTKVYNLSIAVRHNKAYEFNNFWVSITQKRPKEKQIKERVNIPLFNNIGKPYGKCTGSLCTQIFPIQKNIKFKNKGKYQISIMHLMRQEPLQGIKDIGIILE